MAESMPEKRQFRGMMLQRYYQDIFNMLVVFDITLEVLAVKE
jgi:hypothetical protein